MQTQYLLSLVIVNGNLTVIVFLLGDVGLK